MRWDSTETTSLQVIVVGHCKKSNGFVFYSPHSKQFYHSSDYKMDEGHPTPTLFSLQYDGDIFIGLYDRSSMATGVEPFPAGAAVIWPCN